MEAVNKIVKVIYYILYTLFHKSHFHYLEINIMKYKHKNYSMQLHNQK